MTRTLTPEQHANLDLEATRPVFVLQLGFSGAVENLSCSGEVTFNGQAYEPGGADLKSYSDGEEASVQILATPSRVANLDAGSWRGGQDFKLYYIAGVPNDDADYTTDEGMLIVDGVIQAATLQKGYITVRGIHKHLAGKITPRINFNELSVIMPAPGSVIELDGEKYILKARR